MTNAISRLVVAAIGAPVVLGLVWLGGWWIVALAAVAGVLAIHEFWLLVKPLRPLSLAVRAAGVTDVRIYGVGVSLTRSGIRVVGSS